MSDQDIAKAAALDFALEPLKKIFGIRPEHDYRLIPEILIGDPDDDVWKKYGHAKQGVPAIAIEQGWHYKGYSGNWNWSEDVFEFTSNSMRESDWESIDEAVAGWGYFETS